MKTSISDAKIIKAMISITERYGVALRNSEILVESLLQTYPEIAEGPRKDNSRGLIRSIKDSIAARFSSDLSDIIIKQDKKWMLLSISKAQEKLNKLQEKPKATNSSLTGAAKKTYSVITRADEESLKAAVNDAIRQGWEPTGGISFTVDNKGEAWSQAIITAKNVTLPEHWLKT